MSWADDMFDDLADDDSPGPHERDVVKTAPPAIGWFVPRLPKKLCTPEQSAFRADLRRRVAERLGRES